MTDTEEKKTEFKFSELDDSAKDTAREKYREGSLRHDWREFVYEDAIRIGALMGIEITIRFKINSPDIYFSGFRSQGDGCCFNGTLYIRDLKGAVERIKDQAPRDERLRHLAADAEALHTQFTVRWITERLKGNIDEVDDNLAVEIVGNDLYYLTRTKPNSEMIDNKMKSGMNELVSGFADWIYHQLEAEYDYQNSNACVDEALIEDLFDEFGETI